MGNRIYYILFASAFLYPTWTSENIDSIAQNPKTKSTLNFDRVCTIYFYDRYEDSETDWWIECGTNRRGKDVLHAKHNVFFR